MFGGIFMFENINKWCYRTNEFSNDNYDYCLKKINAQYDIIINVIQYFEISGEVVISYSIEAVHGIWQF